MIKMTTTVKVEIKRDAQQIFPGPEIKAIFDIDGESDSPLVKVPDGAIDLQVSLPCTSAKRIFFQATRDIQVKLVHEGLTVLTAPLKRIVADWPYLDAGKITGVYLSNDTGLDAEVLIVSVGDDEAPGPTIPANSVPGDFTVAGKLTVIGEIDPPAITLDHVTPGSLANPAAAKTKFFVDTADGHLKKKNPAGVVSDLEAAASGESNTASNVGSGVGIFKDKSGVDLRFRRLYAGTNVTIEQPDSDTVRISATGGGGPAPTISYPKDPGITVADVGKLAMVVAGVAQLYEQEPTVPPSTPSVEITLNEISIAGNPGSPEARAFGTFAFGPGGTLDGETITFTAPNIAPMPIVFTFRDNPGSETDIQTDGDPQNAAQNAWQAFQTYGPFGDPGSIQFNDPPQMLEPGITGLIVRAGDGYPGAAGNDLIRLEDTSANIEVRDTNPMGFFNNGVDGVPADPRSEFNFQDSQYGAFGLNANDSWTPGGDADSDAEAIRQAFQNAFDNTFPPGIWVATRSGSVITLSRDGDPVALGDLLLETTDNDTPSGFSDIVVNLGLEIPAHSEKPYLGKITGVSGSNVLIDPDRLTTIRVTEDVVEGQNWAGKSGGIYPAVGADAAGGRVLQTQVAGQLALVSQNA